MSDSRPSKGTYVPRLGLIVSVPCIIVVRLKKGPKGNQTPFPTAFHAPSAAYNLHTSQLFSNFHFSNMLAVHTDLSLPFVLQIRRQAIEEEEASEDELTFEEVIA
jgi:hypothetical protein